ncbi:hypothetical protein TNCV_2023651 [Trichonephila clavipes]|nr:hypothetical protein TNCV_2023651 [Trichonephila clavipes]
MKTEENGPARGFRDDLFVWFKQARSQNALISEPLILERRNELAHQMGITFSANPGYVWNVSNTMGGKHTSGKEDETDQAIDEPDEIMHINRDTIAKVNMTKVIDMKRLS